MGSRLGCIALLVATTACSSSPETPTDAPKDPVSTAQQPVVGTCTIEMFGQPCSTGSSWPPDSGGSAGECANVCWSTGNGQPACVPLQDVGLTLQDLNGRICGTLAGTSCNNTCLNGACVAIPASAGAACRPNEDAGLGTTCDGSCQPAGGGAMTCKPLAAKDAGACSFGPSGCSFHACDMKNASVCQTFDVYPSSLCDDGNACTTFDYCSPTGTCAGIPKNCDDGNPCTNDTCDPTSGACIGVPNTNPCSDGNPCTVGDTCNLAVCHPGLVTPGCDAGAGGSGGFGGLDSGPGGFGGFDSGPGGFGGFDSGPGGFGGFDSGPGGFGGFVPDSGPGGFGGVFDSGPGGFGGLGPSDSGNVGGLGGVGGFGGADAATSNAGDGGSDGGCGCYVPSQERSGHSGWLLLVAAAASLVRRRR